MGSVLWLRRSGSGISATAKAPRGSWMTSGVGPSSHPYKPRPGRRLTHPTLASLKAAATAARGTDADMAAITARANVCGPLDHAQWTYA
jgi:hypothetical protein